MTDWGMLRRSSVPPHRRRFGRAVSAVLSSTLISISAYGADAAPRAAGSSIATRDKLPVVRPDFPAPTDPNIIFYIQRSTNSNTVVYTANFRGDGKLDPRQPVKAFWRRFNTTGEKKDLGFFEQRLAYGVTSRKTGVPGQYAVTFVALPGRNAVIQQNPDGSLDVQLKMGKYQTKPAYAYVEVDEGGLVPRVDSVKLYGIDEGSGKAVIETIRVSGGDIRE